MSFIRQEANQLLLLGNQILDIQEAKSENFSMHFCIPTFMLLNFQINDFLNVQAGVPLISKKFNVTTEFARKRLILFKNQIIQTKMDEEFKRQMKTLYPKVNPDNYSDETKAILSKLRSQVAAKERVMNA
ncbi:hypothetical protein QFZ72_004422 [Bacillus sp. V2I10]|nr:hypothetical protein [Bacillus sp. V2I10]